MNIQPLDDRVLVEFQDETEERNRFRAHHTGYGKREAEKWSRGRRRHGRRPPIQGEGGRKNPVR